ncbi:MAG: hypothetical protein IAE91_11245, partial [Ignavibacteriaceae bacterium]|nr:hypothetical protein [Ignavibacteriaceae bacterium]
MSGKIISQEEASKEFGSVSERINIESADLLSIANTFEGDDFLINILEGKLVLANVARTKFYPSQTVLKKD